LKVVSNTTTLIAFLGLGKLSILKDLFGKLIIPKAVHCELSRKTTPSLEEWIEVIEIKDSLTFRKVFEQSDHCVGTGLVCIKNMLSAYARKPAGAISSH
jgi:predicted nucleic acid-binding protein